MSEHALSEEGEIKNTVATACDDSEISVEEVKMFGRVEFTTMLNISEFDTLNILTITSLWALI